MTSRLEGAWTQTPTAWSILFLSNLFSSEWEKQKPFCPKYSCSLRKIDMVKALYGWEFNDIGGFRYLHWTTIRCVVI